MRQLGEQWIEKLDGKKHMLKAVPPVYLCQGCCFNCNQGVCCWKGFDSCHMGNYFIIKDLGILNKDGCLPCPFCGEYPEIQGGGLSRAEGYLVFCDGTSHSVTAGAFMTKQEAINEWNRRA